MWRKSLRAVAVMAENQRAQKRCETLAHVGKRAKPREGEMPKIGTGRKMLSTADASRVVAVKMGPATSSPIEVR